MITFDSLVFPDKIPLASWSPIRAAQTTITSIQIGDRRIINRFSRTIRGRIWRAFPAIMKHIDISIKLWALCNICRKKETCFLRLFEDKISAICGAHGYRRDVFSCDLRTIGQWSKTIPGIHSLLEASSQQNARRQSRTLWRLDIPLLSKTWSL